jgi:plastocyanin
MKLSLPVLGLCAIAFVSLTSLTACGGSSNSSPTSPSTPAPPPAAAADVTITIQGMAGGQSFSPAGAAVKAGQTVAWKNSDSIGHAIAQDGGGFSTPAIGPGATSAPIMISTTGTLAYHCSIHPSMTGSLTVTQ